MHWFGCVSLFSSPSPHPTVIADVVCIVVISNDSNKCVLVLTHIVVVYKECFLAET